MRKAKKLFCALFTAALLLSLCPAFTAAAYAAEEINISNLTNGARGSGWYFYSDILTVSNGADVKISGSNADVNITVAPNAAAIL